MKQITLEEKKRAINWDNPRQTTVTMQDDLSEAVIAIRYKGSKNGNDMGNSRAINMIAHFYINNHPDFNNDETI